MSDYIFIIISLIIISATFVWRSFIKSKIPFISDLYIFYSSTIILLANIAIYFNLISYEYYPFIPDFNFEFKNYLSKYFFLILIIYIFHIFIRQTLSPIRILINNDFLKNIRLDKTFKLNINQLQFNTLFFPSLTFLDYFLPNQTEGAVAIVGIPLAISSIYSICTNRIKLIRKIILIFPVLFFLILTFLNYISSKRYFIIPLFSILIIIGASIINNPKYSKKTLLKKIRLFLKFLLTFFVLIFLVLVSQILRTEFLTIDIFFESIKILFLNPKFTLMYTIRYLEAGNIGINSFDFLNYTMNGDIFQYDIGTYGKVFGLGFLPFTGESLRINDVYTGFVDPIGRSLGNSMPIINLVTFASYNWFIGFLLFLFTLLTLDWTQIIIFKVLKKFQVVGWSITLYSLFQLSRGSDLSLYFYTVVIILIIGFFITRFIEYRS